MFHLRPSRSQVYYKCSDAFSLLTESMILVAFEVLSSETTGCFNCIFGELFAYHHRKNCILTNKKKMIASIHVDLYSHRGSWAHVLHVYMAMYVHRRPWSLHVIHIYIYIYIFIYIYKYIYIYVAMYVHKMPLLLHVVHVYTAVHM